MKKKITLLIFISLFFFCYAENNYFIVNFYKPFDRELTYTEEFLFYDDGLIKQITHYDLRKECDYYDWENIKKDLKIIRKYEVNRTDKTIEVFLRENNKEKLDRIIERINDDVTKITFLNLSEVYSTTINLQSLEDLISNSYIHLAGEKAYLVDNKIQRLIDTSNKKFGDEEQKLTYDGKNVYRIATNHPYGEETSTVTFVSDYIPFTKKNAILNFEISNGTSMSVVFSSVPTVSKSTVLYTDFKDKSHTIFVDNKNSLLAVNTDKALKLTGNNQFGLDYYTDDNNVKKLLLKNEAISLLYEKDESTPFIIGLSDESKIIQTGQIEASSFLKEGRTEYKAENLKSLRLKHPWVEGVRGSGEGEYIQLNKKNATGMYLLNGYISLDRSNLYEKNNRIEKITVTGLSSKREKDILLLDTAKPQYIDLNGFEDNEEIRLSIKSIYKGTEYDDTCLAGIILIH